MNLKAIKVYSFVLIFILLTLVSSCSSADGNDNSNVTAETDVPVKKDKQYLGITPENEIDLNDAGVYVYYMSNATAAGYIAGEAK